LELDLHAARAPDFYLDNCTSGSEGRAEVAAIWSAASPDPTAVKAL
jgi:hypothetical protein